GAKIDVHKAPVVAVCDLRAEPVHLVVVAVDPYQVCSVDEGVQDLGGLQVRGHQDVGLQTKARGVGGHGIGQVSGRGAAYGVEAEDPGRGEGHRDHTI